MTSSFYILAGVGATDFGGDSKFTGNFGARLQDPAAGLACGPCCRRGPGVQLGPAGVNKLASNLEAHLGLTVFF
ncbi:MAG: hypothetical protein WDM77_19575 [Steroidobacteraceae bacterium]